MVDVAAILKAYDVRGVVPDDLDESVAAIEDTYGGSDGITVDHHLDGRTVNAEQWWFNVRASNTEPLLRLNVEARDAATMARIRDEVLALITGAPKNEEN
jgi:phosphomannomutase